MQALRRMTIVLLTAITIAPPAYAGGPQAPNAKALADVVQQHAAKQDANRKVIHAALDRPDVRDVADRLGVDLDRIAASLDTMAPGDLEKAATAAREVNQKLDERMVGGDTITISTTAIILILLVVLLIVVVAH